MVNRRNFLKLGAVTAAGAGVVRPKKVIAQETKSRKKVVWIIHTLVVQNATPLLLCVPCVRVDAPPLRIKMATML